MRSLQGNTMVRHSVICRPGPFGPGLSGGSKRTRPTLGWLCAFTAMAAAYSIQPLYTQTNRVVLYEGARLISGDGSAPIDDSALLVENGTITRVGRKGGVTAPAG